MSALSHQLYFCKLLIYWQISCALFPVLYSALIRGLPKTFAFSKYLAVSKCLHGSELSNEVFRIISLHQNHHWISFTTFYIIFPLIFVAMTVPQYSQMYVDVHTWMNHLPIDFLVTQHATSKAWYLGNTYISLASLILCLVVFMSCTRSLCTWIRCGSGETTSHFRAPLLSNLVQSSICSSLPPGGREKVSVAFKYCPRQKQP